MIMINELKKLYKKIFVKELPMYQRIDGFWVQYVDKKSVENRFEFFKQICAGKDIIHFGCNDWPIFKPEYNLHIFLSKVTRSIHGFDVDVEGLEHLKAHVNQPYFSNFNDLKENRYDICIVPETIEHVDNVRTFLEGIESINAQTFYITAPNCFSKRHINRNHYEDDSFIEIVHPDHNYWFSPFTLKNVIHKYTSLQVEEVILLERDTMVCCKAIKKNV
ncbi:MULTISPECIES: methyltransferase domain-containing protein [Flavobacterium]|nr:MULTISPECIES: hypothetical protein [Flavobacterium]AMA49818.1 hypothetical protein AWN65_10335 [Flavobacterium covae]AND64654.1 hypothetical protein AX766_09590 [Flavobacterium covae]MCJ1805686.1 hypothetical protein [Flavobacterium covae]MCJ1809828.1 hypothetical protein [Flavobacterium covae]OWP80651.1 hypothetical protein BWK63_09800 [Flavobacterium covae]